MPPLPLLVLDQAIFPPSLPLTLTWPLPFLRRCTLRWLLRPLVLNGGPSLSWRRLLRHGPLNLFTSLLRWLRAGALLRLLWHVIALGILLPGASLLRRFPLIPLILLFSLFPLRPLFPLFPLGPCGRCWHDLLLIVLPHHGVTRLIAVILAMQFMLLLYAGIPIP